MAAVRIIVTIVGPSEAEVSDALADRLRRIELAQAEDGCVQYELFRGVSSPAMLVLTEHWSDRDAYDRHWKAQVERDGLPSPRPGWSSSVEIYEYRRFQLKDAGWVPAEMERHSATIRWG